MRAVCHCGHSIEAHDEGGECEGCANDGEPGYCQGYGTWGYEDEAGDLWPIPSSSR